MQSSSSIPMLASNSPSTTPRRRVKVLLDDAVQGPFVSGVEVVREGSVVFSFHIWHPLNKRGMDLVVVVVDGIVAAAVVGVVGCC